MEHQLPHRLLVQVFSTFQLRLLRAASLTTSGPGSLIWSTHSADWAYYSVGAELAGRWVWLRVWSPKDWPKAGHPSPPQQLVKSVATQLVPEDMLSVPSPFPQSGRNKCFQTELSMWSLRSSSSSSCISASACALVNHFFWTCIFSFLL